MPEPQIECTVILAPSGKDLIQRVNQKITEGWIPLGGASAAVPRDGELALCQAMTRSA